MSLRICILETDILRPELIERYEGYGRMFQQLFAKQPIAAEFVIYNVVEGRYPADDERFDAYLVTGSKADSFGPDPWIRTLKPSSWTATSAATSSSACVSATSCWPCCSVARPSAPARAGAWASTSTS